MLRLFSFFAAALVCSATLCGYPFRATAAEWQDPESLDIYDAAVSQFLDVDTSALFDAAWKAYQDQDYEKSAQYYLALLHTDFGNSGTMYNLACDYGLLGEAALAADFVERSFNAGFEDVEHMQSDPDLDPVRDDPVFKETMERIQASAAELKAERGNEVFFKEPVFLRGRVFLPTDYDPHTAYPLVVGLHGFGSGPDEYVKLWKRFETVDFIYVVPQAPYPFLSDIDAVGYSWGYWTATSSLPPRSWKMSQDYVADVIEQMRSLYQVSDVYLLGFSQGAGMALSAGIANHNQVSGIIAFGSWLEDQWLSPDQLAHGSNVRVFIAHGNKDGIVDFESGKAAYDKLSELGYDVTFHEFDGGHAVPEDVIHVVEQWMKAPPAEETEEE